MRVRNNAGLRKKILYGILSCGALYFIFTGLRSFFIIYVLFTTPSDPYQHVLDAPQYASLTQAAAMSVDHIQVNGHIIIFPKNNWKAALYEPRKDLKGVNTLVLSNENKDKLLNVFIRLPENDNEPLMVANVMLSVGTGAYGGSWSEGSAFTCGRTDTETFMIEDHHFKDVNAHFDIDTLSQTSKHLLLKGSVSIDNSILPAWPPYLCKEGKQTANIEKPISFSMENLRFDIDSGVIYRWAGMDGHFYEL